MNKNIDDKYIMVFRMHRGFIKTLHKWQAHVVLGGQIDSFVT